MKNLRVSFNGQVSNIGKYIDNIEAYKAAEKCIKDSLGEVVAYRCKTNMTEIEFRSHLCGNGVFVVD